MNPLYQIPAWNGHSPIALLNTSIITAPGLYDCFEITPETARQLCAEYPLQSYIGHVSTAQIMSELLEIPVEQSRDQLSQVVGQFAIVFKLDGRAQEGVILTRGEIEKIGYQLLGMQRLK